MKKMENVYFRVYCVKRIYKYEKRIFPMPLGVYNYGEDYYNNFNNHNSWQDKMVINRHEIQH